jgi:hypothetical protein
VRLVTHDVTVEAKVTLRADNSFTFTVHGKAYSGTGWQNDASAIVELLRWIHEDQANP